MNIMITSSDILFIILIIIFIAVIVSARRSEKKKWNNGECPKCKNKWRHFDTDSQGGRGYTCDKCNDVIWISYHVDK